MKYLGLTVAVLVILAAIGPTLAAVPTPVKQWEELRLPPNTWTDFGTVTDGVDGSVLVGAQGAGGGIYEIGTTQSGGTGVVKSSIAPSDAWSPVIVGDHVYYSRGEIWDPNKGPSGGYSYAVGRVDLADFGNASDFVWAWEYGIEDNSGFLTSDGSYLYMGWHPNPSQTGQHRTRKLDVVNGTPQGGDPFSLEKLWDPGVHATDSGGATRITYDPVTQNIYTTANGQMYWEYPFVGKHEVWHNPSDPTDQPTEIGLTRPMNETWADTWTTPGASRAQRYGDYVFVCHSTPPGGPIRPGTVAVYEVLNEGLWGLDVANVQEFQLTTEGTLQDIAIHGNGTDPLGMWVLETQVIESVNNYFMQYYTLGGGPVYNRGDVTEDDFVGADDLVRILTHWGESGSVPWENGDCAPYGDGSAPGDDFVGADDYVEVLTYWGTDYSSPEPTPEPATLGLLLIGGVLVLRRR